MIDDIALFIHIVREGSLSAAARQLSLPPATVTRRLQKLEDQLGCQLLNRSARQCVPTQDGEIYYQTYADLVEQFEQAERRLSKETSQLTGKLKVLAPTNISHGFMRPMWLGFTRDYPDIQLELILSNQLEDIITNKADLALRIGPQNDSLLYQQRLGELETVVVASPDYLATAPALNHPNDLKQHRVIGTTLRQKWRLSHGDTGTTQEVFHRFDVMFNDIEFVNYLARDGQGVGLLPIVEVQKHLDTGELVRVLPEWRGERRDIYIVWPSGKLLNARARCLRTYLQAFMQQHFVGHPPS